MKMLVFIFILALANITIGISYPTWCDTGILVLAEEEERSSEHSEEEVCNQMSDYTIYPPSENKLIIPSTTIIRWFLQDQTTLPTGIQNIHDIPPEV